MIEYDDMFDDEIGAVYTLRYANSVSVQEGSGTGVNV